MSNKYETHINLFRPEFGKMRKFIPEIAGCSCAHDKAELAKRCPEVMR